MWKSSICLFSQFILLHFKTPLIYKAIYGIFLQSIIQKHNLKFQAATAN